MLKRLAIKWLTLCPATICMVWIAALLVVNAQGDADTSQPTDAPLWKKATDYLSQNHWIPGEIIEHERAYNLKGELEEESRFVLGFSPGKNGLIRLSVIAAEENGKDIANQVRSAIEGEIPLSELIEDSPFAPKAGQRVTYRMSGEHRRINHHNCTEFQFNMRSKDEDVDGTVWLDQKTGLPLEIHARITSVPFMEEDLKITAYHSSDYFTITSQGHCLLKRSTVEMEVEVSKIGFKGRVVNESVGIDHWKYGHGQ